jgi:hypothetical protein
MDIPKKKRGRKPKNINTKITTIETINEYTNTEDEKIIFHLPITTSEINNNIECDNVNSDENNINNDIFIKDESKNTYSESNTLSDFNSTYNQNTFILNNINKIITYSSNFTPTTKCWWCKNTFDTPSVQLPENYYNETFYCIGNFCSYNCVKSYNLDLNDSLLYKRESLIHLLYYLTYSEYKNIKLAPHWLTLIDYGGTLTIEEFRDNTTSNTKEYLILHPPLISRQMQIEESYKINKLHEVHIDKINKIYSEIDSEYIIKRNKKLSLSQFNLESTMGLIKKKKCKII